MADDNGVVYAYYTCRECGSGGSDPEAVPMRCWQCGALVDVETRIKEYPAEAR